MINDAIIQTTSPYACLLYTSYFKDVVGFLFQNFALLENKTVKENLEIIKKSGRTDISINEALEMCIRDSP